ncbi:MAG: hypothetical protein QMD85_01965, partial [Candidatus Aenigmarchaeota archaeon]|nr:hypothetical protein [Candidatus Aenigmarchaeota archaeon]MDI6722316.1 hypothetical protein [Candidatus Aenigmarchaeota archaeon]
AEKDKRILESDLRNAGERRREEIESQIKNLERNIEESKSSPPYLLNIVYNPGRNLAYLLDILDRKVTIIDEGRERTLNEIEKEIFITNEIIEAVGNGEYSRVLNATRDSGYYLLHFLDDPYAISFSNLHEMDRNSVNKQISDLYG